MLFTAMTMPGHALYRHDHVAMFQTAMTSQLIMTAVQHTGTPAALMASPSLRTCTFQPMSYSLKLW